MAYLLLLALVLGQIASSEPVHPIEVVYEPNRTDVVEVSDRSKKQSQSFKKDIEKGRLREKTNGALDAIVRFAVYKLEKKGKKAEAKKLLQEWENQWSGYLLRRDIGSHKPFSKWLSDKYSMLELILGVDVCHALRLDDIWIINYALPVVFACVDKVDEYEYQKHFVPLSGTVVYWLSFFTCVGGTWGGGFFFCGPVAFGCEWITENLIAPKLNHSVWRLVCRPDEGLTLPEYIPQEVQAGLIGGRDEQHDD